MLSNDYEKEQEKLQEQVEKLTVEITETEEQSDNLERFSKMCIYPRTASD